MSRIAIYLRRTGDSDRRTAGHLAMRPLRLPYCGAEKRRRDTAAPCRGRRVLIARRDLLRRRARAVPPLRPLASALFCQWFCSFPVRARPQIAAVGPLSIEASLLSSMLGESTELYA